MINNIEKQQGGFLKLIIFIIVALFLLNYFNVSFSDVIDWIKALFNNVTA
ncbi:MAG: hypothetical protein WCS86_00965 [Candidatus Paceibacterota bacterium]